MSIFVGGRFGGLFYLVGRGFHEWFLAKVLKSEELSIFRDWAIRFGTVNTFGQPPTRARDPTRYDKTPERCSP